MVKLDNQVLGGSFIVHTFTQPTPAEINAYLRRARSLRGNTVRAFFHWLADKIAQRRHAAPAAKWA